MKTEKTDNKLPFNKAVEILRYWFLGSDKKIASIGLFLIVMLIISSVYISVLINFWSKDFFNAIEQKNIDLFWNLLIKYSFMLTGAMIVSFTSKYFIAWYSFRWRQWLTNYLINSWLSHHNYYKLTLISNKADNPDQRIAQDATNVAYTTTALFEILLQSTINFIIFSVILWDLSEYIQFTWFEPYHKIPGILLWIAIIYSSVGVIFTFLIGHPLIDLERMQAKREAGFRYKLMRIKERSEEIATLQGEKFESQTLLDAFILIKQNYFTTLRCKVYIHLFHSFYFNLNSYFPLFIAAPSYFEGVITMGILIQIRGTFNQVESSLSSISASFYTIADYISSLKRLHSFLANLDNKSNYIYKNISNNQRIVIKNLKLVTSDFSSDIPDIEVNPGDRKLIITKEIHGKTSFFRCLAGITKNYKANNKTILELPSKIMFIPQKTYLPITTLAKALTYPSNIKISDQMLMQYLDKCHLGHLKTKLRVVDQYQHILSLSEQQKINFIRILLHRPKWLVLDEPVTSIDKESTAELINLIHLELPDTGILAISHHPLPHFKEI